jgi:hypothetical protein
MSFKQKPAEADFLRVDKRFEAHEPESMKKLYTYKSSAERAISRLKQHLSLKNRRVKFPNSRAWLSHWKSIK